MSVHAGYECRSLRRRKNAGAIPLCSIDHYT
jgi:hypothetical protein